VKDGNVTRLKAVDRVEKKLMQHTDTPEAPESSLDDEILEQAGVSTPQEEKINPEPSEDVYQAYGVVKSPLAGIRGIPPLVTQEQLEIRKRENSGYLMPYSLVMLTGYAGDHTITLYCATYVVIIEGKHLIELRELLEANKVRWIQEFDRKRLDMSLKELPEGTPVITEIRVKFGRE